MAKKKLTHLENAQNNVVKPREEFLQTRQPKSNDGSAEKLEHLKSLNSMLLKETVERRQQVDSLQRSKLALESELTRSETERKGLVAELTRVTEGFVGLEVEKSMMGVFLASEIDGFRENVSGLVEEKEGLLGEKEEREKRVDRLEREVAEVCRERDEVERVMKKRECEIKSKKERVEQLVAALEGEGDLLRRVSLQRDDFKLEANGLRLEMLEMEKSKGAIQEAFRKLETEFEGLRQEKDEKERVVESLVMDKGLSQKSFEKSLQMIEGLKRDLRGIVEEKIQIEEVNGKLEVRICELQGELGQCHEAISILQNKEEGLHRKVLEMKKSRGEATEKQKQMEKKINDLVEETEEKERNFMILIHQKESVMRSLQETLNQLEAQEKKMEDIVQEKSEMEDFKIQQEMRIVELKSKVDELTNAGLTLQRLCKDSEKMNKLLSEDVEYYKNAADRLLLEKDTAVNGLDYEKKNGLELKSRVSEADKKLDETLKMLEQVRCEYSSLNGEKEALEGQCKMLMMEKSMVEKNLGEAQNEISNMRVKLESAGINAGRVLTMLKNTSAVLCHAKDDGTGKRGMVVDEHHVAEEIQPYVAELEAINKAFENTEMKAEEMKQQLLFLQNSLAKERKQKSVWTAISSATTVVAAASVAYVAKGR